MATNNNDNDNTRKLKLTTPKRNLKRYTSPLDQRRNGLPSPLRRANGHSTGFRIRKPPIYHILTRHASLTHQVDNIREDSTKTLEWMGSLIKRAKNVLKELDEDDIALEEELYEEARKRKLHENMIQGILDHSLNESQPIDISKSQDSIGYSGNVDHLLDDSDEASNIEQDEGEAESDQALVILTDSEPEQEQYQEEDNMDEEHTVTAHDIQTLSSQESGIISDEDMLNETTPEYEEEGDQVEIGEEIYTDNIQHQNNINTSDEIGIEEKSSYKHDDYYNDSDVESEENNISNESILEEHALKAYSEGKFDDSRMIYNADSNISVNQIPNETDRIDINVETGNSDLYENETANEQLIDQTRSRMLPSAELHDTINSVADILSSIPKNANGYIGDSINNDIDSNNISEEVHQNHHLDRGNDISQINDIIIDVDNLSSGEDNDNHYDETDEGSDVDVSEEMDDEHDSLDRSKSADQHAIDTSVENEIIFGNDNIINPAESLDTSTDYQSIATAVFQHLNHEVPKSDNVSSENDSNMDDMQTAQSMDSEHSITSEQKVSLDKKLVDQTDFVSDNVSFNPIIHGNPNILNISQDLTNEDNSIYYSVNEESENILPLNDKEENTSESHYIKPKYEVQISNSVYSESSYENDSELESPPIDYISPFHSDPFSSSPDEINAQALLKETLRSLSNNQKERWSSASQTDQQSNKSDVHGTEHLITTSNSVETISARDMNSEVNTDENVVQESERANETEVHNMENTSIYFDAPIEPVVVQDEYDINSQNDVLNLVHASHDIEEPTTNNGLLDMLATAAQTQENKQAEPEESTIDENKENAKVNEILLDHHRDEGSMSIATGENVSLISSNEESSPVNIDIESVSKSSSNIESYNEEEESRSTQRLDHSDIHDDGDADMDINMASDPEDGMVTALQQQDVYHADTLNELSEHSDERNTFATIITPEGISAPTFPGTNNLTDHHIEQYSPIKYPTPTESGINSDTDSNEGTNYHAGMMSIQLNDEVRHGAIDTDTLLNVIGTAEEANDVIAHTTNILEAANVDVSRDSDSQLEGGFDSKSDNNIISDNDDFSEQDVEMLDSPDVGGSNTEKIEKVPTLAKRIFISPVMALESLANRIKKVSNVAETFVSTIDLLHSESNENTEVPSESDHDMENIGDPPQVIENNNEPSVLTQTKKLINGQDVLLNDETRTLMNTVSIENTNKLIDSVKTLETLADTLQELPDTAFILPSTSNSNISSDNMGTLLEPIQEDSKQELSNDEIYEDASGKDSEFVSKTLNASIDILNEDYVSEENSFTSFSSNDNDDIVRNTPSSDLKSDPPSEPESNEATNLDISGNTTGIHNVGVSTIDDDEMMQSESRNQTSFDGSRIKLGDSVPPNELEIMDEKNESNEESKHGTVETYVQQYDETSESKENEVESHKIVNEEDMEEDREMTVNQQDTLPNNQDMENDSIDNGKKKSSPDITGDVINPENIVTDGNLVIDVPAKVNSLVEETEPSGIKPETINVEIERQIHSKFKEPGHERIENLRHEQQEVEKSPQKRTKDKNKNRNRNRNRNFRKRKISITEGKSSDGSKKKTRKGGLGKNKNRTLHRPKSL